MKLQKVALTTLCACICAATSANAHANANHDLARKILAMGSSYNSSSVAPTPKKKAVAQPQPVLTDDKRKLSSIDDSDLLARIEQRLNLKAGSTAEPVAQTPVVKVPTPKTSTPSVSAQSSVNQTTSVIDAIQKRIEAKPEPVAQASKPTAPTKPSSSLVAADVAQVIESITKRYQQEKNSTAPTETKSANTLSAVAKATASAGAFAAKTVVVTKAAQAAAASTAATTAASSIVSSKALTAAAVTKRIATAPTKSVAAPQPAPTLYSAPAARPMPKQTFKTAFSSGTMDTWVPPRRTSVLRQRSNLAKNTAGLGFGPQSPRDIDKTYGINQAFFGKAPAKEKMNVCNIYFTKNSGHKGGDFTRYDETNRGYQFDGELSFAEKRPVSSRICANGNQSLKPGDTIEVQFVHSTARVQPGPTFAACVNAQTQNPQLRIESQVAVLVNDLEATSFNDLTLYNNIDGFYQAYNIPKNTGTPVEYIGSTVGAQYNEQGSPLQVTWGVRPNVIKVDINSVGQWCDSNVFDETSAHPVRNLVLNTDLLSPIE